jgi:hypothetical protein
VIAAINFDVQLVVGEIEIDYSVLEAIVEMDMLEDVLDRERVEDGHHPAF